MGVPQNIMRALCAEILLDHFKFASYGPVLGDHINKSLCTQVKCPIASSGQEVYSILCG